MKQSVENRTRITLAITALLLAPSGCSEGVAARGGHGILLIQERAIEGQYIVKIDETAVQMRGGGRDVSREIAVELADDVGGRVLQSLDGGNGIFAVELSEEGAEELAWDRRVAYVETDAEITVSTVQDEPPSWGIDRIDQRALPLDASYEYEPGGSGVNVYVIDTGVRASHKELTGRVLEGFSVVNDGYGTDDCDGHGTHVAGTVAGTHAGVAKQANIIPVRVFGCSGSGAHSDVIAGVQWVVENAKLPAVINASLGGASSPAVVEAFEKAAEAGITVVAAAGNERQDACNVSPANAPSAITVGATNRNDGFALDFSNFGSCVDILAPGADIVSASNTGDTDAKALNGTSMAAPHVAGMAALLLERDPTAKPQAVRTQILGSATPDVISVVPHDTPNLLLYVGTTFGAEDPVPVDPDPGTPDPGTPDPGTPDPGTPDPELPDPETPDPSACTDACNAAQERCSGYGLGLHCGQLCGSGVGDPDCFDAVNVCVEMASCL